MSDSQLLRRLTDLRDTVRRRLVLYGLCAVTAGGVLAALGLIAVDWLLWLPGPLRLVLGLAYLVGGLAAVWYWIVQPLQRQLSLSQLAGKLEQYMWRLGDGTLGRFEDRLSSTVDFLLGSPAGSEEMRRRVISNTDRIVEHVRFTDALSLRPLAASGAALAVTALLASIVWLQAPGFGSIGLRRYAAPFADLQWPRRVEIVPLSFDTRVAVGEAVNLELRIARGMTASLRPLVRLRGADGNVTNQSMQRQGADLYTCTISAITEDLTCWFRAGDDTTRHRPLHIKVIQRPAVVDALVVVDPPDYAPQAESVALDLRGGLLTATRGSRVQLTVRTSKPIQALPHRFADAELVFSEGPATALQFADDFQTLTGTFELDSDKQFRIRLLDRDGFDNPAGRLHRIVARPDQPPNVVILEPKALTEVTPHGSVSLLIRADDDYGITALELAGRSRDQDQPFVIPLTEAMAVAPTGDRVLALCEHLWSIASLGLAPGDVLHFHAQATDNYAYRGAAAQQGFSAELRLKVISQADFEARLRDRIALWQDRIRQARMDQAALQDETRTQAALAESKDAPPGTQAHSAVILARRQARLADRVRDLAKRFDRLRRQIELNIAQPEGGESAMSEQIAALADLLKRTAAGPMRSASRRLAQAGGDEATNRRTLLEQADGDQQTSLEALARTLRLMDRWGDFQEVVTKTRDLFDRQQELHARTVRQGKQTMGRLPESLTADEQAELKRTTRRQRQLAEDARNLLERLRRLSERLRQKDPAGADALDQALRAALAGEVVEHMDAAAEAIEANRTGAALIDQRTAETALSRMLAGLQERQGRQLAELAKRVEDAGQAVAEILRQQRERLDANLEARGVEAADQVFHQQAPRQRTVKRNTLRLADDLYDMPGVSGPAGLVRQAVGPMDQAATNLEEARSSDAEAAQTEAVDLLTQAVADLDEMARKINDEAAKRSLAVVRAGLEAIRNRQQDVNDKTELLIERAADARKLTRAEYRRAARLARIQDEQRPAIEELLPRLGRAPVYQWVLETVLELVDQSGEALRRRALDEDLAENQQRIVGELDVLIDALQQAAQPHQPDRYAEGSSSGGGQPTRAAQQSAIPSVAELLVLRTMQQQLNDRT
ncbi:MAG: hypothetical protein IID40_02430, partial [Planctomycetes bacterium]|nr:hypothetical protein [Planctomycetota bacterium]